MHFLAPILATFTTLATLATLVSASGYTDPAWSMTTHNQSALFGYQLVGSNMFNTAAVCNNISIASHGLWNAVIDDTYIQRAFCDQISSNDSNWDQYDLIKQNIRFFSTGTFLSQLMHAFDLSRYPNISLSPTTLIPTSPYTHLCATLQPAYLEALNLDSTRIRSALCAAAFANTNTNLTQTPPPPPANTTALNDTVLTTYDQYASVLFTYVLILTSTSTPEADALCDLAQANEPGVENTGLKGIVVYNVACGRDGRRMSNNEALGSVARWSTKVFLQVLEHVSKEVGWMEWLCGNLSAEAMDVVGLKGEAAVEEVCGRGRVGEKWCSDPWLC